MARRRAHTPLLTFLNDRLVGRLSKQPSGAIDYRIHEITGRHFVETAQRARLPRSLVERAIAEIIAAAATAFERVQPTLPPTFPGAIHDSVQAAATVRVRQLEHTWE